MFFGLIFLGAVSAGPLLQQFRLLPLNALETRVMTAQPPFDSSIECDLGYNKRIADAIASAYQDRYNANGCKNTSVRATNPPLDSKCKNWKAKRIAWINEAVYWSQECAPWRGDTKPF